MKNTGRGRLAILGSGETAHSMVEMHRAVFAAAGPGPALVLDSSYGFQENADALTQKAVRYFAHSVGRATTALRWRNRLEGAELDRALTALRNARAVYAGPGSPSYTMRMWDGSGFAEAVAAMVEAGGTGTFSSAAAIALGVVAMPTHEIYRCGADPYWLPGTDLLGRLSGISAAVVPHYDLQPKNGSHDTRCCYIGERRMVQLEEQLPAGAHLIGIDEHTALILDLESGTARVAGLGGVTIRSADFREVLPTGTEVPLAALRPSTDTPRDTQPATAASDDSVDMADTAETTYAAFTAALKNRRADTAAETVLELEQSLAGSTTGWESPVKAVQARRLLRGMVLELADAAAEGLGDPREQIEPLVEALLEQRAAARARRDFATADSVRDRLSAAGVEVRDCPLGAEWSLREPTADRTSMVSAM